MAEATLYELAAECDGERVLLAYCHRKTRQALFKVLSTRATEYTVLFNDEQVTFAKRAADGAIMGRWKIWFTGRTKRDCLQEGELPIAIIHLAGRAAVARFVRNNPGKHAVAYVMESCSVPMKDIEAVVKSGAAKITISDGVELIESADVKVVHLSR